MRKRLLAATSMVAMTIGILVAVTGSPASAADCSGRDNHPDVYGATSITWGNGTSIRVYPNIECARAGQGFPGQGIDVHCAINAGGAGHLHWLYVRNTSTGVSGWARQDALNHPGTQAIPDCDAPSAVTHTF
jgi:hypothetical protein